MNVNNINNPIGPDRPVDRNRDTASIKPERAEGFHETEETPELTPEVEETEQATRDTFQVSQEPRLVEELTRTVENMEETPREDAVARARERVQNGYYNNDEFLGRLALKIVNIEPPSA